MRLLRGLKHLFNRSRAESDLASELHSYIDLAADEKMRQGMPPAAARSAALREFGGVEAVKEEVRDTRTFAGLETVSQDVRYAIRGLRKSPGFAAIALLSLALGVGANSAIFSVFYAVVVRPLPYPDSGRLAAVGHGAPGQTGAWVLTPEFVAWQNDQQVFTGLASWNDAQYNLTGAAFPERLVAAQVSPNFLQVLGIRPSAGRDFLPADQHTAILTHEVWQRQFGGDGAAIGRSILLSNTSYTVVGVLPSGFRFPADYHAELLVPDILPNPPDFAAP